MMVVKKRMGLPMVALLVLTTLNPAVGYAANGALGQTSGWFQYDTFIDSACGSPYVTVWFYSDVLRLADEGVIRSYRWVWRCHRICLDSPNRRCPLGAGWPQ